MRTILAIITAVFVLGRGHAVYALSTVTQITTTNIQSNYSFIIIKAQDAEGGCKRFRVIVTQQRAIKPENFKGYLSVYREGKLIVSCAVPSGKLERKSKDVDASVRDKSVVF
jgi:hypothetical protein